MSLYYNEREEIERKLQAAKEIAELAEKLLDLDDSSQAEETSHRATSIQLRDAQKELRDAQSDLANTQAQNRLLAEDLAAVNARVDELSTQRVWSERARERLEAAIDGFEALLAYRQQMADLDMSQEIATQNAAIDEWQTEHAEMVALIDGLNAHAHIQAEQLASYESLIQMQSNQICLQISRANKAEAIANGLNAHAHIQAEQLADARMRIGVLDTTLITRNDQIKGACDKIVALRDQLDAFKTLDRRALVHAMRDIHTELALEPTDEPEDAPWATLLTVLEPFVQALRAADPSLDTPDPEPSAGA